MWASMSLSWIQSSELVAQADRRIIRGGFVSGASKQETAGETVLHLRPHDTCIGIEVPRKPVIGDKGHRIQRSTARRRDSSRASTRRVGAVHEAVLVFVIVGQRQIEIGPDRIFRTSPEHLKHLVGGEVGVVGSKDSIATF